MTEVEESHNHVTLQGTADLGRRIEVITLLFQKAEVKVTHADMYRQRNMNYALIVFAGLVALGLDLSEYLAQLIVSGTLLILMFIFCIWDRRWHKTKHGWQSTAREAYQKLCEITNHPEKDIALPLYKLEGEAKAEYSSWQPVIFYFLVAGAVLSFWLFYLARG